MEKKNKEQIQYTGHRLHIRCGCQTQRGLLLDTSLPSEKVFMLPDKTRIRATKKMRLKYNLRPEASKMNIVPNLHSMLISVTKMADTDYIAVFDKKEARIFFCYDYHRINNKRPHPHRTTLPGHQTVETQPGL
jgi:hypothetical protein